MTANFSRRVAWIVLTLLLLALLGYLSTIFQIQVTRVPSEFKFFPQPCTCCKSTSNTAAVSAAAAAAASAAAAAAAAASAAATTTLERDRQLIAQLVKAKRLLAEAHRKTRSGSARLALQEAFGEVANGLESLQAVRSNQSPSHALESYSSVGKGNSLFVETHIGHTKAYPWFIEGYYLRVKDANNTKAPSWSKLLHILTTTRTCKDAERVWNGFTKLKNRFPSYKINLLQKAPRSLYSNDKCNNKNIAQLNGDTLTGSQWKNLLTKLNSEFVLIARNLELLNWFALAERMLDMAHRAPADVVGAATRTSNGHWTAGCFQSNMRNYTVKLVEGYDVSYRSCMYCDYVSGPVLMRRSLALQLLRNHLSGEELWLDFFLQLKHFHPNKLVLACPDAMYHVTANAPSVLFTRKSLLPLARQWKLNRVLLPGQTHAFSCKEAAVSCGVSKGKFQPICCIEELGAHVKAVVKNIYEAGASMEFDYGSVIGLLKNGVLPWELDQDLSVQARMWPKFLARLPQFAKAGFKMAASYEHGKDAVACEKRAGGKYANCGYYAMRRGGFRTEIYASSQLSDYINEDIGLTNLNHSTTVIYYDGAWIPVPINPGLYARNMYFDNTFMHVQHWMTLGHKTGWSNYTSVKLGRFTNCTEATELKLHGCLNGNYLGDGNLQFKEYV